jgi:hypothetical protein
MNPWILPCKSFHDTVANILKDLGRLDKVGLRRKKGTDHTPKRSKVAGGFQTQREFLQQLSFLAAIAAFTAS